MVTRAAKLPLRTRWASVVVNCIIVLYSSPMIASCLEDAFLSFSVEDSLLLRGSALDWSTILAERRGGTGVGSVESEAGVRHENKLPRTVPGRQDCRARWLRLAIRGRAGGVAYGRVEEPDIHGARSKRGVWLK